MKWLPVIPSLYSMTSTADIFSILIAHGMILNRGLQNKPSSGLSNTTLAAKVVDACTNPNCKAKKWSTHSTANCYWPGRGKEGQFPLNFRQRAQANAASSNQGTTKHFVLSARVPDTPGNSGVIFGDDEVERTAAIALVSKSFQNFNGGEIPTFIDLGASDTMFMSRKAFNEYKSTVPCSGDSTKVVDGNFEIVGERTVVKHYLDDGIEKKLTYTRAIHTPTWNANLISMSAFNKAGLTVTFGGGCGVI